MDNSQQNAPVAAPQEQDLTAEQRQRARIELKQEQALKVEQIKRNFEDNRSRIREMLKPENRSTNIVINSREEFLAMNAAYKSLSNRDDKVLMDGYPETDADRVRLVAELTAAMTDFTEVLEKSDEKQYTDAMAKKSDPVTTVRNLAAFEFQLLAWKILLAVCDAHLGRNNVPLWPKTWNHESYQSFNDRFRDVTNFVRRSKALISHIMDSEVPFVRRLATSPKLELRRKKNNWGWGHMKAGRRDSRKGKQMDDEPEDDKDNGRGNAASERDLGSRNLSLLNHHQSDGAGYKAILGHQLKLPRMADYTSQTNAVSSVSSSSVLDSNDQSTDATPVYDNQSSQIATPSPADNQQDNFNIYDESVTESSNLNGAGIEDDHLDPSS